MDGYVIYIEPKAATRPRFSRRGRFVSTYHEPTYKEYLDELRSYGFDKTYEGLVSMEVIFYCTKAKTSKLLTPRGDLDNFVKGFLDGLQPELILDDKQVVELYAKKEFIEDGSKPRIEFSIEEYSGK